MYYQSLSGIEKFLNNTSKSKYNQNKELIIPLIEKLDDWLISKPNFLRHRLSSNEFGFDNGISSELSMILFMAGLESEIFDYYFEVRDYDNFEYLGNITLEDYNKILSNGKIIKKFHFEEEVEINYEMVYIFFKLKIKPETSFLDNGPKPRGPKNNKLTSMNTDIFMMIMDQQEGQ
ncbi:hypothetical protein G7084_03850 [Weissella coleopterorum]|uniref:Uncharacterized protein n=1 Tax=Weissella coleopterorum TaxID=2714949 RepID=A0A6G8AZX9_9LACO|nr:hypothetical protein [Weissella coleopterorum]QIL50522.1 hypothetical protein G7084_03850 [Weissella coleopterorum]